MVCLFGFKDTTLPFIHPYHFLLSLRIADSFKELYVNVIVGHSLTGALAVAAKALVAVLVRREVEAWRAWINYWFEDSF